MCESCLGRPSGDFIKIMPILFDLMYYHHNINFIFVKSCRAMILKGGNSKFVLKIQG